MRPDTPIIELKGIGEKTARIFEKLGLYTIKDMLSYFPRDYDVLENVCEVGKLQVGMRSLTRLTIVKGPMERKTPKMTVTIFQAADETGALQLVFFRMPFIKNVLKKGKTYYFRGSVSAKGNVLSMEQPQFLTTADFEELKDRRMPIYPLTSGLSQKMMRKVMKQALDSVSIAETLPEIVLRNMSLVDLDRAIRTLHFPDSFEELLLARDRAAFEEFFLYIYRIRRWKDGNGEPANDFPMIETADTVRFLEALPFRLTEDQLKAWTEIQEDLCGPHAMNRLIQGDVGSGKTILSFLAMVLAASNGYQSALMAPTEVLATQHFQALTEYKTKYGLNIVPVLLTGGMKAADRRKAAAMIESGEGTVIIGTHALFQEKVNYCNLGLVITDEQHRFGVQQREKLAQKSAGAHRIPHVMVMSATPIPRTLAMILYGDLHISTIHSMPNGRLAIKNCVVDPSYRPKAYRFLEKEIAGGSQGFVICPMIEPEEECNLENVKEYAEQLRQALPEEIRIEVLHGAMKPAAKQDVMQRYADGEIDLLVSTTVIEVGINVPNATVMMVENADRFGLAQLHQLRGRVGRGDKQSYCIFVNTSDSQHSKERLEVLNRSNDGFHIAQEDLKQRGPGDLFGVRQSGELNFVVADIYQDADLLTAADREVARILAMEPEERDIICRELDELLQCGTSDSVDFPSI